MHVVMICWSFDTLQLYRCGLRLEEISDQLGSQAPLSRVPNQEARRNSYSELLNRYTGLPVDPDRSFPHFELLLGQI